MSISECPIAPYSKGGPEDEATSLPGAAYRLKRIDEEFLTRLTEEEANALLIEN